jgi:AcrR family transcriptional regulator
MANDTRLRIVLTAMQLFWEKGYGSTSIADVLQGAGVNSGSLYHFFPGKQDLLLAVLDLYEAGMHPMLLEPAWAGVDDPVERVFALLARYRQSIVDTDCSYGCPIGSIALEIHEPDPPVREALARNFDGWTAAIRGCLLAAGDRLPRTLDRQALAEFVLTTMEGGVMQARTHRDVGVFDRTVRQLRDYFDLLERTAAAAPPETPARRRARRSSPQERP